MEQITWMVCGTTVVAAAVMAHRHPRATLVGRWALAVLFVAAGAVVNLVYLLTGTDYADFADASFVPFVRDTWQSVVGPNQEVFIGLLVAFEAIVGVLVVTGGRRTQVALAAIMGFHACLLVFSWWFWIWAVPMLAACALLLRAERRPARSATPAPPRPGVRPREPVTLT